MTQTSNKSEFDLILALVTHPAAFELGLFTMLDICRMEDGRYAVTENDLTDDSCKQKLFKDPRRAVRYFIKKRHETKLGFDWEHYGFRPDKYEKPGTV